MQIISVVDPGAETAAQNEVSSILGIDSEARKGSIVFGADFDAAAKYSYLCQVPRRTGILVAEKDDLEELGDVPEELKELLKDKTFKALSIGAAPNMSQEIIEAFGEWIFKAGFKVDIKKPQRNVIVAHDGRKYCAFVDLVGGPLEKREYRIMLSRRSLRATVAAAATYLAGISEGDKVLNLIADDGTWAVETSLILNGVSPRQFERKLTFEEMETRDWKEWKKQFVAKGAHLSAFCEQLRETKAVRQNAKLAGVHEYIYSTKIGVDWLDLKVEESSVDFVLAYPSSSSKTVPASRTDKAVDNLCNQASHILKEGGKLVLLCDKPEEIEPFAKEYGFEEETRQVIHMGKRVITFIMWRN